MLGASPCGASKPVGGGKASADMSVGLGIADAEKTLGVVHAPECDFALQIVRFAQSRSQALNIAAHPYIDRGRISGKRFNC